LRRTASTKKSPDEIEEGLEMTLSEKLVPPENTRKETLFPKIFRLANMIVEMKSLPEYQSPATTVPLIGSLKLHGTHADIMFESANSKDYRLQSRFQRNLKAGQRDNAGFAAWVADLGEKQIVLYQLRDKFVARYQKLNPEQNVEGEVIIAAEWCGLGIQKNDAITKVPRFLAIVSIFINGSWVPDWDYADIEDVENRIFNVGRIGYFRHELRPDDEGLAESQAKLLRMANQVEKECPFAQQVFEESGLGEGIVWKAVKHCGDTKYWFKSKGDLHEVSKVCQLSASEIAMENKERTRNFAKAIVTENRLDQGWDLLRHKDTNGLGWFLRWVMDDCMIEEKLEMEHLKISKDKLLPVIEAIAKSWYLNKIA
jgi:hypothetical protein